MGYPVVGFGPGWAPVLQPVFRSSLGQGAPARAQATPASIVSCDTVALQAAVDNAAQRIAYYQQQTQAAAAAGDDAGVSAASASSDVANTDWNAAKNALSSCQAGPAPMTTPTSIVSNKTLIAVGALAVSMVLVGAIFGIPKIG